ncbi:GatB/YqeY domain-containing protein [Candidatus Uhrbacteria bacterium]|nr:GatB/YqeY domain-containing protein [Candidatus Uhrbacteria bacterium]
MTLVDQVASDLTTAMKAKDAVATAALRMLKTSLGNAEIEARGSGKKFDDALELACVKRHAKQLAEAAEEYRKGGRADLVSQAESELKIIEKYLPAAMSEEEVRKVIATVRAKSGAMQMGPFMGAVMKELQGKADGTMVRKIVEEMLR